MRDLKRTLLGGADDFDTPTTIKLNDVLSMGIVCVTILMYNVYLGFLLFIGVNIFFAFAADSAHVYYKCLCACMFV